MVCLHGDILKQISVIFYSLFPIPYSLKKVISYYLFPISYSLLPIPFYFPHSPTSISKYLWHYPYPKDPWYYESHQRHIYPERKEIHSPITSPLHFSPFIPSFKSLPHMGTALQQAKQPARKRFPAGCFLLAKNEWFIQIRLIYNDYSKI